MVVHIQGMPICLIYLQNWGDHPHDCQVITAKQQTALHGTHARTLAPPPPSIHAMQQYNINFVQKLVHSQDTRQPEIKLPRLKPQRLADCDPLSPHTALLLACSMSKTAQSADPARHTTLKDSSGQLCQALFVQTHTHPL